MINTNDRSKRYMRKKVSVYIRDIESFGKMINIHKRGISLSTRKSDCINNYHTMPSNMDPRVPKEEVDEWFLHIS